MDLAKKMIIAKNAGADAVKFQTFSADKLASINTPKVNIKLIKTIWKKVTMKCLKNELSFDDHIILDSFCKANNIMFLSTPYDVESAKFLNESLNIKYFKTASADIVDIPLRNIFPQPQNRVSSLQECQHRKCKGFMRFIILMI